MIKKKRKKVDANTWAKVMEKLREIPPEVEYTEQCYHREIVKVIDDDTVYFCKNCNVLIDISAAKLFTYEQFIAMLGMSLSKLKSNKAFKKENVTKALSLVMEEIDR